MHHSNSSSSTTNSDYNIDDDDTKPLSYTNKSSHAVKHWWRNMANPMQKNEIITIIVMLCTLLFDTTNKVSFRIMLYSMKPYAYYVNQLNTVTSIPIYYLLYRLSVHFHPMKPEEWDAMKKFPKYHFGIMAVFDSATSVVNFIASSNLSGPITILLMQSSIPVSMLFSYFYLGSRYAKRQYLGAIIVIVGICISVYPSLKHGGTEDTSLMWVIVFIVGQAPQAFSNVYREHVLRNSGVTIEPNYLNYWLSVYQFFVTMPMVWPSFRAAGIPLSDLPQNFKEGTRCWLTGNSGGDWDCTGAPLWLNIFLVANVLSHTFQLLTVEYGSAALLTLLSALRIPLASAAFSIKAIAGENATPLKTNDLIAVSVILTGVMCYKFNFVSKLNMSFRRGINTGITVFPHEADDSLKYSRSVPKAILAYRKQMAQGVKNPVSKLLFGTEKEPILKQVSVDQQKHYSSL